jgi:L-serine dehydratase
MTISVFDLFKIGIGPSSSHTVGPMKAARMFVSGMSEAGQLEQVHRIQIELYGSLAATGKGHGSDKAVLLGLAGEMPETVDPGNIDNIITAIISSGNIQLDPQHTISFTLRADLLFLKKKSLPGHPNGMIFIATDTSGSILSRKAYFSVGGGFVVEHSDVDTIRILPAENAVKYAFRSGLELLHICEQGNLKVSDVMLANEAFWRPEEETLESLKHIWQVMQDCVLRGCRTEGVMPGKLGVERRAPDLYKRLSNQGESAYADPLAAMDWVNLYALAVNEENASGGRVVTAPTNGAAGIIPAVAHYYSRFIGGSNDLGVCRFLLTAGAIGLLYKENASLSGAEVGCQGEVGVACSMAAGALTEVMGGTPAQVENAAEIGMEHNLGLTCDPVGGLVQIPCIERNAMGAMKAINAARLALRGDGHHHISLDKVIRTMHQTGKDMKTKYKETSRGGLAVNIIEC